MPIILLKKLFENRNINSRKKSVPHFDPASIVAILLRSSRSCCDRRDPAANVAILLRMSRSSCDRRDPAAIVAILLRSSRSCCDRRDPAAIIENTCCDAINSHCFFNPLSDRQSQDDCLIITDCHCSLVVFSARF